MTFFNWSSDSGKARVSSYLWIYVVVTICFTAITIGLWYFFVMFRRNGAARSDEEKLRVE
jgi:ABC-type multidrug transport system permease subunit